MALGTELFLAVTGREQIDKVLADLHLTYDWDSREFGPADVLDSINERLATAHKKSLLDLGLEIVDPSRLKRSDGQKVEAGNYLFVKGTDGIIRETDRFILDVYYDPHEMGEEPEHAVLGVSLISRYFPVYLDWQKEHGGSGDPISLTPDVLRQIAIARGHISTVLPFIADAPIAIKELHY